MSSGIDIAVLFALPWFVGGSGGMVAGAGTVAATASAASAPAVVGTSAVAAGGAVPVSVAGVGLGLAIGGIVVVGAGAAAFMAGRYLHHEFHRAIEEYNACLEAQRTRHAASTLAHESATQAALSLVARANVKAETDANAAFLLAGIDRLKSRLDDWPDSGPHLPTACAELRRRVENDRQNFPAHFEAYEKLSTAVAQLAAQSRAGLANSATQTDTERETLQNALRAEMESLKADLSATVFAASDSTLFETLNRKIAEVEHLTLTQPRMAQQSVTLLRQRLARELTWAAQRQAEEQKRRQERAATLRELAGHISARSQAAIKALDLNSAEITQYSTELESYTEFLDWRARAETHLRRLAELLAGDLPPDLGPLRQLAQESSGLFDAIDRKLYEIAMQSYLESQVAEVFTELGYRVTTLDGESKSARSNCVVATVSPEIGVQIKADGQGVLSSEMVALSPNAIEVDEAMQERVCQLMDEVFDALRQRGHNVRERKRRHSKAGRDRLRLVKTRKSSSDGSLATPSAATPLKRRIGG